MTTTSNPHLGSTLDDLLDSDGTRAEAEAVAVKRVIAWQIDEAMTSERLGKAEMARRMNTSRAALDRLLDPDNVSVTLRTLHKAAAALDKRLEIGLVDSRT
ncbi:MAG: Fis family transcriptional regulator [Chloroflexi bacterium]|nr:Fis family transcriptional regulator [Chloroflexota bacterium]